jgi:predicted metal-dependent hydrolase
MAASLPVEIVRSTRRKRTVEAQIVNGTIRVHVPARMKQSEVDRYTAELVARLQRAEASDRIDLVARSGVLARRYKLPLPKSIRFVDNQKSQWGSCTPATGEIRLSSRLTQFPSWVLDYVIVHELAHLVEFHHNAKFLALVDQYPKAERARGFLTGVHYSPDGNSEGDVDDEAVGNNAVDDDTVIDLTESATVSRVPNMVLSDKVALDYKPTLF